MAGNIAMYYTLSISGVEIDSYRKSLIEDITIQENASGSDVLSITISDPDFTFLDDNIFVEEVPVSFIGGISSNESPIKFDGFISIIDVNFPQEGIPSLVIHCMDESHLMNRRKRKRSWKNVRDSDVAESIYKEYGFKTVIEPTPKVRKNLSQSSQTDIDFVLGLANKQKDYPFITYVKNGTAYFIKKPVVEQSETDLGYRTGNGYLMSFNPRINKESKMEETDGSDIKLDDASVASDIANDSTQRDLQGESVKGSTNYIYTGRGNWKKD